MTLIIFKSVCNNEMFYKGTALYKSLFLFIWLIVLFVSCCELILYVVIPCFF